MGVAASTLLFLSIVGCIAYGLINWSRESTVPPVTVREDEQNNF